TFLPGLYYLVHFTLQLHGRFLNPERTNHIRFNRRKACFLKFIHSLRKFATGQVHLLHNIIVHYIDHYFFGSVDVLQGMLNSIVPYPAGGRKYQYRRLAAKNIEKAKRRQVWSSVFVYSAGKTNRPWRYRA